MLGVMSENREYFCFKFFVYHCVRARNAILRNSSFHAQETPSISKSRHVPALGKDVFLVVLVAFASCAISLSGAGRILPEGIDQTSRITPFPTVLTTPKGCETGPTVCSTSVHSRELESFTIELTKAVLSAQLF